MPATINNQGYIRVSFPGFDKPLTSWRGQRVRHMPIKEKQELCQFFNMAILSGNLDAVKTWFPREQAKYLIKKIAWQWLEHKTKRPATIHQQADILKKYIIPRVGDKSVKEITRQDFYWIRETWGDTQMARGVRATAQAILNWAWREDMMDRQIYLPTITVSKKPTPYIEIEDRWKIYNEVDPQYRDPVLLSIEQGMRVGEIVALQWNAIDFENEKIKLIRALSKHQIVDMRKGGDEVWIDMTEKVKDMLSRRKQPMGSLWVFPAQKGNHTWSNRVSKAFKDAAKKIGLPHARLHDCRHSVAIDMRLEGHPLEYIQERLGQKERKTTERYIGQVGFRRLKRVRGIR